MNAKRAGKSVRRVRASAAAPEELVSYRWYGRAVTVMSGLPLFRTRWLRETSDPRMPPHFRRRGRQSHGKAHRQLQATDTNADSSVIPAWRFRGDVQIPYNRWVFRRHASTSGAATENKRRTRR